MAVNPDHIRDAAERATAEIEKVFIEYGADCFTWDIDPDGGITGLTFGGEYAIRQIIRDEIAKILKEADTDGRK